LISHYEPYEEEISDKVILIDPTDTEFTVTFSPLERIPGVLISEQVNELISSFKRIWAASWGVRMEDMMRNSLITLGETELTLVELPRFLGNRAFRRAVLKKVNHPVAIEYFKRFNSLTDRSQVTWVEPVMNKINSFFSDERIMQMFASPRSSFNLREAMDEKKIVLIKLDKGRLKNSADLLGSLLMAKIQLAAFSRSDVPPNKRTPFYLYIDEFQNFASESFSVILSEARKYGLSLIMAHQTLSQIPTELRSLILGNTGIQIYFRLNRQDASLLAKEAFEYSGYEIKTVSSFRPVFWSLEEEWEHYIEELQALPPRICYVKHKIEGGVIPLETVEIVPGWEDLGMKEEEFLEVQKKYHFGKKYLVSRGELKALREQRQKLVKEEIEARSKPKSLAGQPREVVREEGLQDEVVALEKQAKIPVGTSQEPSRDEIGLLEYISYHPGRFVTQIYKDLGLSGYKGDKLKTNLIKKKLIRQEETRAGQKGRLAKILVLTDNGELTLRKLSLPGKGGDLHKHLQMMIKEQAELFGWKARIEERIPRSLESVDVGLAKDDMRVAIEISSTTQPDQEIYNIRKCLEAGYDYILSVCDNKESLQAIKKEARKNFTARERERIRFYIPEQVKGFLSSLDSARIVSEKGIVSGQIKKEKQLLDTKEASEFLGISKNTLYEWILQRKIPHIKVGRLVKFRREDLEAWLKRRTQEEEKDFV